jgi:hypothetical protein
MATNDYHFITQWRVQGTLDEVSDILGDPLDLPRWWPSVYLEVNELEKGDKHGVGRVIDLYTKGWLPYTLRWKFLITDVRRDGSTLEATGDFNGRGIWTFEQDGPWINATYDWKISADKPLLRLLSPIMKPILEANHRWAMQKGEESLKLELARRHATTPEERARIPAPPPATTSSPLPLLLGTSGIVALGVAAIYWLLRLFGR